MSIGGKYGKSLLQEYIALTTADLKGKNCRGGDG